MIDKQSYPAFFFFFGVWGRGGGGGGVLGEEADS